MVQHRYRSSTRFGQALLIMLASSLANAQKPSADDVNKANNPLTPVITVNFQDQAQPLLYDLDQGPMHFFSAEFSRTSWEACTSSFAIPCLWLLHPMERVAQIEAMNPLQQPIPHRVYIHASHYCDRWFVQYLARAGSKDSHRPNVPL